MNDTPGAPPTPAPAERAAFRFGERLRVRWAEVDLQQVVFNGHYLMYLDTAMAGYWRALALPYQQTMAALDGDLFVRKAVLEYHGPARYDDRLDVGLRCARIGRSSLVFDAAVSRAGQTLVDGELVYVYVTARDRRPAPVPEPLRAALQGFEAGAGSLRVRWEEQAAGGASVASPSGLAAATAAGPGASAPVPVDGSAAVAWRGVAYNPLGAAVGRIRLTPAVAGEPAWIEDLTVHPALQGAGIGRALVAAAVAAAAERGERRLRVAAAVAAADFFRRLGFEPTADALGVDPAGRMRLERRLGDGPPASPGPPADRAAMPSPARSRDGSGRAPGDPGCDRER